MGMKLKSGADLCGFQLTNFCVQGEASAPSDAALGRKYFHTNATDDVATGISLLHRERIYLGEGAWRATAYLDDIAAINEKLNLITGDTDTDTLINNLKDLEEFLKDFSETDKLKSLLDGKLSTSGGNMTAGIGLIVPTKSYWAAGFNYIDQSSNPIAQIGGYSNADGTIDRLYFGFGAGPWNGANALLIRKDSITYNNYPLIHSGNIGDYALKRVDQVGDLNSVSAGEFFFSTYQAANRPSTNFSGGLTLQVLKNSTEDQRIQLAFGTDYVGYVRGYANGTYTAWKTIAFTDSDITGYSAGLKHSNGTVGASVYETGALLINNAGIYSEDGARLLLQFNGTELSVGYGMRNYGPTILHGKTIQFNIGDASKMIINSSSNVTIGGSDLAGTSTKLYVNGNIKTDGYLQFTSLGNDAFTITSIENTASGLIIERARTENSNKASIIPLIISQRGGGVAAKFDGNDLYIAGNLIVDGEISAGGAGAEEGGSGSAEGVSEIFTPTSTSMVFNHNLGEDVIVQVYEKNNSVWNLVMVDTEITSATRVTLRFGKTETTQHKVVIMGV